MTEACIHARVTAPLLSGNSRSFLSDLQIGGDVDEDEGMKQIKEELIEVTESAEEVEVKKEEEPDEEDN